MPPASDPEVPDPLAVHVLVGATPDQDPGRPARERVAAQSRGARAALAELARRLGLPAPATPKDDAGRPLPWAGWHWSLSHDAERVAAALARRPVGVDLERETLRRPELLARVLDGDERALLAHLAPADGFTRAWTAKEAVLKACGLGLAGLRRCKVVGVEDLAPEDSAPEDLAPEERSPVDPTRPAPGADPGVYPTPHPNAGLTGTPARARCTLELDGRTCRVELRRWDEHWIALHLDGDGWRVHWHSE